MTVHVLSEYEPRALQLEPDVVETLVSRHSQHLGLSPLPGNGRWLVTAKSYVGSIGVGETSFLIRPKAWLSNLLAMMDVEVASEMWSREVVALQTDPDLLAVMARLFCVACEYVTARGLRRSYVTEEELLVAPRGRINVAEIVRQPGLANPVPCRFDEHTADIPINRLLRAAVERARRIPSLAPVWKHRLRAQLVELADAVTPMRDFTWIPTWQPGPMERHYASAVRLAHLLLTHASVRDMAGDVATNAFLLNMNDLFEKWVTRRLSEVSRDVDVVAQNQTTLGTGRDVQMEADITFWREGQVIAVADCKYKLMHDGEGNNPDYYQALAYATAYDLHDVWLIYARFPDDPVGSTVNVRNSERRLHTVGIDLTTPVDHTLAEIHDLAHKIISMPRHNTRAQPSGQKYRHQR